MNTPLSPVSLQRPRIMRVEKTETTPPLRRVPHVITITSGKGGVGKTNFTANLGWQLRQMRQRVMILDADLGLANIDIVLGLSPEFNMSHVVRGEKSLKDILTRGPAGLRILPAGSGESDVTELNDSQKLELLQQLESLEEEFDFLLIDTGAGIASNVIYFNLAAQTTIVVVTPEPTSMTDAYALIKVLSSKYHQTHFRILANDVKDEADGLDVFTKLSQVTDRFLNVSLDFLGHITHDASMRDAICMQRPVCEVFHNGPAAGCIRKLARSIVDLENNPMASDLGLLWRNVLLGHGNANG